MNISLNDMEPTEIAKIVRKTRENKDWTQEQLAMEVGRTWRTIAYIESGSHKPYSRTLRKLERALFGKHENTVTSEFL